MHKAALPLVVFVTVLMGSGCWWTTYHYGANTREIKKGVTTRAEIFQAYGRPDAETPDGRFVLYSYSDETVITSLEDRAWSIGLRKTHLPGMGRVLVEFDNNDRVKRRTGHPCEAYDPLCDPDPSASLLAMLGRYYDASLARKYEVKKQRDAQ